MIHLEDITRNPAAHQEVFRRVWERVMADRPAEQSPVEASEDAAHSAPVPPPALPPLTADPGGSDFSGEEALPPAPEAPSSCLRRQILEALESWQLYRHLARRTHSTAARSLAVLASDQHRLARRLAAAYFLLTGLRYWPTETLPPPIIPSLWGSLRRQHRAEQQRELTFRMAAGETTDPSLRELYAELARDCQEHCRQLRGLLEQSCP